jgi:hypothetical protein
LNALRDPFKGFRADLDLERLWLNLFCHGIDSVYRTWWLYLYSRGQGGEKSVTEGS